MIKLHPLPPKGIIGIMAPSSPVDEDKLQRGVTYFEKLGYRVRVSGGCRTRDHYLAGSAESRAFELMQLVHDPSVHAIFFARGGFGSAAMLPLLDYPAIRSTRKLMVGFSDITALQWGIYAMTRLPSLSAGMPATDFSFDPVHPDFEEHFWKFIETGIIDYRINAIFSKQDGEVQGISLPGTLSVAAKLSGTPWLPDLHQTIPILEDVDESRHRIEGSLLQAKLSGWFDRCNAVILGEFTPPEQETFPENPSLETIFQRIFHDLDLPVVHGIPYGHIPHKIPFPVGSQILLSLGSSVRIFSTNTLFDF